MSGIADTRPDWFAGFVDGEGCFFVWTTPKHDRPAWRPGFNITLRADDVAILRRLRDEFGGVVYVNHPRSSRSGKRNPRAQWSVHSKRDLLGLVSYFDAHPLLAKKARDFGIWREAVFAYSRAGMRAEELEGLREALMASRGYDVADAELPSSEEIHEQLGLEA